MQVKSVKVVWTEKFLEWQLGEDHDVNPLRGYLTVEMMRGFDQMPVEVLETWASAGDVTRQRWLDAALEIQPRAREIVEENPGTLEMFGGTYTLIELLLLDRMVNQEMNIYFNPAGGELSGQHPDVDVLNDLAYAAMRLRDAGLRVVVVSLDAHHANQTESLLRRDSDIVTFSVHEAESASTTYSSESFVNYGLEAGAGDVELMTAVDDILSRLEGEDIDVLLMDIGTDGLEGDDSSSLEYTAQGLSMAAIKFGQMAARKGASVVLGAGGAGGELSLDEVPLLWANMVLVMGGTMYMGTMLEKTLSETLDTSGGSE